MKYKYEDENILPEENEEKTKKSKKSFFHTLKKLGHITKKQFYGTKTIVNSISKKVDSSKTLDKFSNQNLINYGRKMEKSIGNKTKKEPIKKSRIHRKN